MTRHDLAKALSARLRARRVDFRPEDVEAFTAGLPDDERRLGVEALTERFLQAARAVELYNRGRQARYNLKFSLIFAAFGLWMFGAGYLVDFAGGPPLAVAMLRGLGLGSACTGVVAAVFSAALMPRSFWRSGRAWREMVRRRRAKPPEARRPAAELPKTSIKSPP